MHPSETILNNIKDNLYQSIDKLSNVFWVDTLVDYKDLPCAVITSSGESIEQYHNNYYIVDLSVEIKYCILEHSQITPLKTLFSIVSAADAIIKDTSLRVDPVMTVREAGTDSIEDSVNISRPVFSVTRLYLIKYKRTRGLV